jgi:threonine dehydratase
MISKTIFNPTAVAEAYYLIQGNLHKTPVLTSSSFDALVGCDLQVYFKAEMFQKTGVFKFRGASHAIARLPKPSLERGVVTHSSGNHSAALASAARQRGVKCYVVMVYQAPN